MDSLTQIVLGAACGEAVLGRKIKNKALLWGAVGGLVPDMDMVFYMMYDPVDSLFVHRGFSHSLLFPLLLAPLLGMVFSRLQKNPDVSWKEWAWLFLFSIGTHPLLDTFTGYGTGLFEPFSNYRAELHTISIIDPLYTLPFLFCLIMVWRAKADVKRRKKWNSTGIALSTAYLLFTAGNQWVMQKNFTAELTKNNIEARSLYVAPAPLSNILWYAIAESGSGFYIGHRSWFDTQPAEFTFFPKNDSLIEDIRSDEKIQKLARFSKSYYTVTKENGKLFFHDLRFGQAGGWSDKKAGFVFVFEIEKHDDGSVTVHRGQWHSPGKNSLGAWWKRLKGN